MIESSIDKIYDAINTSDEYKEYQEITKILKDNKEVNTLIEEIKSLEKKATKLEYNNDESYKEIDKLIEEKNNELNAIPAYQEYLNKLKTFNNVMMASSSLIQDYVNDKVSI